MEEEARRGTWEDTEESPTGGPAVADSLVHAACKNMSQAAHVLQRSTSMGLPGVHLSKRDSRPLKQAQAADALPATEAAKGQPEALPKQTQHQMFY